MPTQPGISLYNMAIIPSGQKFHTVPSNVQTAERGSALANSQREIYTMQDIIDSVPSGGVQSVVAGANITVDDTDPSNPIVSAVGVGSGVQGFHALIKLTTSLSINASINGSGTPSIAALSNRLASVPFIPNQTFTSANLYINVTASVASALTKILIYSDLNGVPNSLLYESADLDCSTTGIKTATTSFTFNAGTTYWLTVFTSSTPNLSGIAITGLLTIRINGTNPVVGLSANNTYGSAPTTYPSSLINTSTTIPCVFITVA